MTPKCKLKCDYEEEFEEENMKFLLRNIETI